MTSGFSSRSTRNKKKDLFFCAALTAASAMLLAFFFILDGLNSKILLALSLSGFFASLLVGETYPVYYVYSFEGDDLSVSRVKGKSVRRVCLIGIDEIKALVLPKEKTKKEKTRKYDYRGALFTRETLKIEFDNGYENGVLLLTCDESFIDSLKSLFTLYNSADLI